MRRDPSPSESLTRFVAESRGVHGVIPAAGEGSRLEEVTDDRPKPMVTVAGRPLITYPLDTLVEVGIDELVVVIGHRGETIIDHLGDSYRDVPITYVHQCEPLGLGHAVLQARPHIEGPFVVLNADNVFGGDLDGVIRRLDDPTIDGIIAIEEATLETACETGVVEVEDGRVTGIVERPEEPPSQLVTTGCYVLPEDVFHACALVQPSARGEYELTDAVDLLVRAGYTIEALPVDGWRVNVNRIDDMERVERLLD